MEEIAASLSCVLFFTTTLMSFSSSSSWELLVVIVIRKRKNLCFWCFCLSCKSAVKWQRLISSCVGKNNTSSKKKKDVMPNWHVRISSIHHYVSVFNEIVFHKFRFVFWVILQKVTDGIGKIRKIITGPLGVVEAFFHSTLINQLRSKCIW